MEEVPTREYKRMRRIETVRRARALNFACFRNQKFLSSPRACQWLAESVTQALAKHEVDLWAYCFMPSHVHLLVFPRSDHPSMANFLASVKKSVARKAVAWVRAHSPTFLPRMLDEQPNGGWPACESPRGISVVILNPWALAGRLGKPSSTMRRVGRGSCTSSRTE